MRAAFVIAGLLLAAIPGTLNANPEKDAINLFVRAVKQGQDLNAAYPGVLSVKETASLQRVVTCDATNLMKQAGGYFTVLWNCGSTGSLGMKVTLEGAKVISVSTFEVVTQPHWGSR